MLLHGCRRRHAVEEFELSIVADNDLAARLVVTGQHAAQHDEVGAGSEGLSHVARTRAAAVRDDVAAEAMGRVGALEHGA